MKKYILFLLLLVPVVAFAQADTVVVEPTPGDTTAATIINVILSAVGIFFAAGWGLVKGKLSQFRNLADTFSAALQDDNITPAEVAAIKAAFKALTKK